MLKKQCEAGFSLIELMIVVAIIGILAVAAMPRYQDYTTRARLAEAVQLLAAARVSVAESLIASGAMPENLAGAGVAQIETEVVKRLQYQRVSANEAVLSVVLHNTGNPEVDNKTFSMRGVNSLQREAAPVTLAGGEQVAQNARGVLSWTCHTGDATGNNAVPVHFLPASCRREHKA